MKNDCNAEHQQLVKDCEARADRLTPWEAGLVLSCKQRLANGWPLTDTQAQKLNEVWDRATEKG
jgi:hypothetical protein